MLWCRVLSVEKLLLFKNSDFQFFSLNNKKRFPSWNNNKLDQRTKIMTDNKQMIVDRGDETDDQPQPQPPQSASETNEMQQRSQTVSTI